MTLPEFWLRGPIDGIDVALQPVAHALLQAQEEVELALSTLAPAELWLEPGGAASAGFHVLHLIGSLDRLLTYARGAALTEAQREELAREKDPPRSLGADWLVGALHAAIARAMDQLRSTSPQVLDEVREVGRAKLPSSVRGLLYHAGEHTARHAGQVVTTVKIVRGLG